MKTPSVSVKAVKSEMLPAPTCYEVHNALNTSPFLFSVSFQNEKHFHALLRFIAVVLKLHK